MGPAIWLALARDELRAAELLAEHGIAPLSCLHADQAIEKALRALHVHREGPGAGARGRGGDKGTGHQGNDFDAAGSPCPGVERRGIAAALASLTRSSGQPAGEDPEMDQAREAVHAAHELIDRITARVYDDAATP